MLFMSYVPSWQAAIIIHPYVMIIKALTTCLGLVKKKISRGYKSCKLTTELNRNYRIKSWTTLATAVPCSLHAHPEKNICSHCSKAPMPQLSSIAQIKTKNVLSHKATVYAIHRRKKAPKKATTHAAGMSLRTHFIFYVSSQTEGLFYWVPRSIH